MLDRLFLIIIVTGHLTLQTNTIIFFSFLHLPFWMMMILLIVIADTIICIDSNNNVTFLGCHVRRAQLLTRQHVIILYNIPTHDTGLCISSIPACYTRPFFHKNKTQQLLEKQPWELLQEEIITSSDN